MYGQDPGFFIDQAQTAGLKAKLYGFEFTPDGVNASKGAYDSVGWTFAYDYFDAGQPDQPAGQALRRPSSRRSTARTPTSTPPTSTRTRFVMWEVIRRVLAKGGDINDGARSTPRCRTTSRSSSVYGGDDSTVGTYTLDPKTHSVIKRPMGVFHYKDKKVTPLAYYGIGGADFKTV